MTSIPPVSTDLLPRPRTRAGAVRLGQWLLRAFFVSVTVAAVTGRLAARPEPAPVAMAQPSHLSPSDATSVPVIPDALPVDDAASLPEEAAEDSACPAGMVEVEGEYCPALVERCIKWIDQNRDRCAEYDPNTRCVGTPEPRHFCMDRYEYPNQEGEKPDVGMTWEQAQTACEAQGKRLCTDSEWTTACEGPNHTPYPDGYVRGSCNVDQPYIMPDDQAFSNPATRAQEIARLSQSEPSGVREECVSDYGIYDLTGNVDEWVVNENGTVSSRPYQSGLKGGYWGPVRNRCRPMTVDHNAWHAGYQIGFRCCSDLPASE